MGLAFDIDDARLSERNRHGHARGAAKAVTTDIEHGQSIDLADADTVAIDDDGAVGNQAANLFLDKVEPQHPLAEGAIDVDSHDAAGIAGARKVRGLAREVVDRLHHAEHTVAI